MQVENDHNEQHSDPARDVAIIGMGCRFPGAQNVRQFWNMLSTGGNAVQPLPPDRRAAMGLPDAHPEVVGGFLDSVDEFDARAFNISPREAKLIDPQQRLLLEVASEAFADAGLRAEDVKGSRTCVYVGIMWNDYARLQTQNPESIDGHSIPGSHFAFAANRLSYFFDLRGTSTALDAGCASSLVALHLACRELRAGDADIAVVGGVNLQLASDAFRSMEQANLWGTSGQCRTLDASADGFVSGEGAGAVILQRLDRAQEERRRIFSVVKGSATNHNGHGKWIMAVNEEAQAELLREAYRDASVSPADVDVVEMHGAGSLQGDAQEATALGAVLGNAEGRSAPLWAGSVKTNIGHLKPASGMSQIIKLALSLRRGQVPASLHYEHPNPEVDLGALHLRVPTQLETIGAADRAAIGAATGLSLGGANAHVVLAAPPPEPAEIGDVAGPLVFPVSARREEDLRPVLSETLEVLGEWRLDQSVALVDVCTTAGARRDHHAHRVAFVTDGLDDLYRQIEAALALPTDEIVSSSRSSLLDGGEPAQLAAAFMDGDSVLWPDQPGARTVSLPHAPFVRRRRWIETADPHVGAAAAGSGDMFDWRAVLLAGRSDMHVWEAEWASPGVGLAAIEQAEGGAAVQASVFLDIARERVVELTGSTAVSLRNVEFDAPVSLEATSTRVVQISVIALGAGLYTFEASSRPSSPPGNQLRTPWLKHASGFLSTEDTNRAGGTHELRVG